ncbi:MAG: periplasmic heavy metal sensor [Pseudomonadota bacterium]
MTTRAPGWMKVALVVSLAVNLLIIGAIAGAVLRGTGPAARGTVNFALPYAQALEPETRRAMMRSVMQSEAGRAIRPRARRQGYADVVALLRADPFDAAALEAAVASQAQAFWTVQGQAQAQWLEIVAGMTAGERAVYAAAVEERLRRPRAKPPRP